MAALAFLLAVTLYDAPLEPEPMTPPIATVTFADACTGDQTYTAAVRPFDVVPPWDRAGGGDDWMPAEYK